MWSNTQFLKSFSAWTFWIGTVAGAASLAIGVASPEWGAAVGFGALLSGLASSLAAQRQSKLIQAQADAEAAALRATIDEDRDFAFAHAASR